MLTTMLAMTFAVHLGSAGMNLSAQDQDVTTPQGAVVVTPVTTGKSEIEGQGRFAAAVPADATDDVTQLEISTGGFFSTGNARSISVTGMGRFRLRRDIHQFRAEVAANYGRAAPDADSDLQDTVTNVQGLLRYDVFMHPRVAAFLQAVGRHDPFQGLVFRLNIDPGFAFYALKEANHRLWFEAGYDFQYDVRTDDSLDILATIEDPATGMSSQVVVGQRDRTAINHAVRLFAGYNNNLNAFLTFDTGLEYLQSVLRGEVFRLNWYNSLSAQLASRVSLAATFTLRYENRPVVPRKLDTITAILLGVRFI